MDKKCKACHQSNVPFDRGYATCKKCMVQKHNSEKRCLKCKTKRATSWKGKYCSKCSSTLFREKHPNYQIEYDKKRGNGEVRRIYARRYYKSNQPRITSQQRSYRKNHLKAYKKAEDYKRRLPKNRFRNAKIKAAKRNLSWTLTLEDFINLIGQPCHYCQNKLGKKVEVGAGLDRIDNNIGYELSNVVPCCKACNMLHFNTLTYEETLQVVKFVLQIRGIN